MPRRLGLDKKELDGAGCKNKSPKTQGSELTHTHICERNSPNWRKLLFRGLRAGIFQGTRSGNLTYLHSNLFAYKHKTTFVSQKAKEQNEEPGWALGVKQWAWHMAKASMEKGTHLI